MSDEDINKFIMLFQGLMNEEIDSLRNNIDSRRRALQKIVGASNLKQFEIDRLYDEMTCAESNITDVLDKLDITLKEYMDNTKDKIHIGTYVISKNPKTEEM